MPKAIKCGLCRFSLRAEKINNLAKSIIAYFVIVLHIMPIGALANAALKHRCITVGEAEKMQWLKAYTHCTDQCSRQQTK